MGRRLGDQYPIKLDQYAGGGVPRRQARTTRPLGLGIGRRPGGKGSRLRTAASGRPVTAASPASVLQYCV